MLQLMQSPMASCELLVVYTVVTTLCSGAFMEGCWQWESVPHDQLCMLQKLNHARWNIDGFGIIANYWIEKEN